MKTLKLSLLSFFLVIFSTGHAQGERSLKQPKRMMRPVITQQATSTETGGFNPVGKIASATCPTSPLAMLAQDTINNNAKNTTYMGNGATTKCTLPFLVFPNVGSLPANQTSSNASIIVAPCINVHYAPFTSNLNTNGSLHIFENGTDIVDYCKTGCNFGTVGGATGVNGNPLNSYVYMMDSGQVYTYQFCNTGTVGTTTVSVESCWDSTKNVYAGPIKWNATTASCFTFTVPATANIGTAFYTISPATGNPGLTDYSNGECYIDPGAIPAGTYTVTYHFKGSNSCAMVTGTYVFKVPTKPTISIAQSGTTTCSGSASTFTASGAGVGGTYTWSPSGINTTTLSATNNPSVSTTYTYGVVGTATTGCYGVDTATVTVNPLPTLTVTSSPTTSVCLGSSATFTAVGANTYTWSSSANGGLGSISGSTVTATPTTTVNATYTVNATDGNGCKNNSSITLNVNALPTLSLTSSPTTSVCSSSSVTLTATGNSTSYTWTSSAGGGLSSSSGSIVTAMPTISPATYTVVGSNAAGCSSIAKTTSFTIINTPTLSLSSSTYTTCLNAPVTFSVSGANSYSWSPTANMNGSTTATPTITPSSTATTVYSVTGSSGGCNSAASTVTLTVNSLPTLTVTVPASYTICNGGSQTFTVSGANSYTWTPSSTLTGTNTANPTASPSTTTVYSVTGTDGNGCTNIASPATATVNVIPPPTLTVTSNSYTICQGSSQTFTATGAGNYSWSPAASILTGANTSTPTADPTTSTVYTLTGTTSGCVPSPPLTVTLTVNPAPTTPTLSNTTLNPLSECQGTNPDTTLILNAVGATNIPLWYLGSNLVATGLTYAPSTNTSGTLYYTVSDSSKTTGCTSANAGNILTVTVTILAPPTAPTLSNTVLNPLKECQGTNPDTTLVLNAVGANTIPVWYLGSILETKGLSYAPSTNTPGTFYYTVSDSSTVTGCTNIKAGNALTVTVTIQAPPGPPTLSNTTLNPLKECQGTNPDTTLVLNAVGANTIPVWYLGSILETKGLSYAPSTNTPGTFYYTVSDSSTVTGCTNIKAGNALTVTVTILAPPGPPTLASSLSDTLLKECQGVTAQTLSLTTTASSIPVWYVGTSSVTVATGYTYTPSTATPTVTIYNIANTSTGTGCSSALIGDVLTVTVTINPKPDLDVSTIKKDTAKCGLATGGITGLTPNNINGGTKPYHYQWYNGNTPILYDTTLVLSHVSSGTYSLLVTDANSCTAVISGGASSFSVPAIARPHAAFSTTPSGNPIVVGSVPLNVAFNNQSTGTGPLTYTWSFGDGSGSNAIDPNHTYTNVNTYDVMLVAIDNICKDTAYITINAEVATTIIIPNVFSPNGDGINDQFFIPNTGMTSLNCEIFSRWGQLLYTLNGPNQAWDGKTPNGDKAPDGTYMYLLQAEGLNGKTYKQQGTLTLIR